MKTRIKLGAALVAALVLAGCETNNFSKYYIERPPRALETKSVRTVAIPRRVQSPKPQRVTRFCNPRSRVPCRAPNRR